MASTPSNVTLELLSQDQTARRMLLFLRCPIFSEGMTSTEIGNNLEKGKEVYRTVVLPRLSRFESSSLVEKEERKDTLAPPRYKLAAQGRLVADWLYEKVLLRKGVLEQWEIDWETALDSGKNAEIEEVRSRIHEEMIDFLYFV